MKTKAIISLIFAGVALADAPVFSHRLTNTPADRFAGNNRSAMQIQLAFDMPIPDPHSPKVPLAFDMPIPDPHSPKVPLAFDMPIPDPHSPKVPLAFDMPIPDPHSPKVPLG